MPQENNMAEVIRLLDTVIRKVDGLDGRVEGLHSQIDGLRSDVHGLKSDVQGLSTGSARMEGELRILRGQLEDVVDKFIDNKRRTDGLEGRVSNLESESH